MAYNTLQNYVKRTLLSSAGEAFKYERSAFKGRPTQTDLKELKAKALEYTCRDAARGTDTGWWAGLIYNVDVIDMASRNRSAILDALADYEEQTGQRFENQDIDAYAIVRAMAKPKARWTADDTEAAMMGVRFAVEWYCSDVAQDLGVEL